MVNKLDSNILGIPENYTELTRVGGSIGFNMPSDIYTGSLLKTLVASKPGGSFLELGTGIGLSLSWMLAGMQADSSMISIENDPELHKLARTYFGKQDRLQLLCVEGGEWISDYKGPGFDLIFADTWPGKYTHLDPTLAILKPGGFYVVDDMAPQGNWPSGHQEKVNTLIDALEAREEFVLTKFNWATGLILGTKKCTF